MKLGVQVGLGPSNIVSDGDPLPSPKRGRSPQIFGPCLLWPNAKCHVYSVRLSFSLSVLSVTLVYCGQTVEWIKMKLGVQVGLVPGHIVLDGDPAPLPQRGTALQFSAHICCGQTAGWIKMPLGRELGFSPDDIVLDGT